MYWFSWIMAWEQAYIKKNEIGGCAERPNDKLEKLYWKDSAWLLWEILKAEGDWKCSQSLKEIIDKNYRFYVYYYNKKNRIKKSYFIISTFMYFLKPVDFVNIYGSHENYAKLLLANGNINSLYKHLIEQKTTDI